jgi:hypothetical protein
MHVKTKNLVPGFDKDLVNLAKKRNRIFYKAILSKLDTDWINFKLLRISFSSLFRKKNLISTRILLGMNPLLVVNSGES